MRQKIDQIRKYIFHLRKGGLKQLLKFHNLNQFEKKIFFQKKLKWNNLGYWQVDPMPTDEELHKFYSELYWLNNSFYKSLILTPRDINHYLFLEEKIFNKLPENIDFMNFGAGHGGISYLMATKKSKIVNIEPSEIPSFKYNNFSNYKNIDEYINKHDPNSIDFIYSSHTVEHLSDPLSFLKKITKVLKKNAFIFIEVPNCRKSLITDDYEEGGCDGKIVGSHLIYFTKDFFMNLNSEISFFKEQNNGQEFIKVESEDTADCIRAIFRAEDIQNWLKDRKFD